jgi:hypothetical protein
MTVYIVIRNHPYQGITIEKVFASYEAAQNYIDNMKSNRSQYDIEERDVHN